MTTYRRPDGTEMLVCDGCGLDDTGSKPDLAGAVQFDLTAALIAAGFPHGTSGQVKDYCPACDKARRRTR